MTRSGPRGGNGKCITWLRERVNYAGDDCLVFPFNRLPHTGYGVMGLNGRTHYANRVMCELVHGPAPTPQHQSAHSCGNGHLGCVNPKHLSWKTRSANQLDRRKHGTSIGVNTWGRRGKLTAAQVVEIRALKGSMTQAKIAERFGCSRENINLIVNGKSR